MFTNSTSTVTSTPIDVSSRTTETSCTLIFKNTTFTDDVEVTYKRTGHVVVLEEKTKNSMYSFPSSFPKGFVSREMEDFFSETLSATVKVPETFLVEGIESTFEEDALVVVLTGQNGGRKAEKTNSKVKSSIVD